MVKVYLDFWFMVAAVSALTINTGATEFEVSDGPSHKFKNNALLKCFGSSHASTALRRDWQDQLEKVHNDLGTEFVRFHGLLDDDMSVVLKAKYNHAADQKENVGKNCTFVPHQDYSDPGGPTVNASTKEECCAACYNTPTGLPQPCVAAVWTKDGKCYTKLDDQSPIQKPTVDITACVTNRTPPKGYEFSFVNIFKVFDFLLSIGMRPVVELSFMPSLLASDPTEVGFWYRGGHSVPRDFSEWRDLISTLAQALIDRYGLEEVEQWYFETWNEPNCGFYAVSNCCGQGCGNQTAYLELYTNTFKAIKSVSTSLRVGGPATAQLGWLDTFMTGAAMEKCPPDFVSSHLYPTDPYIDHGREGFATAIENAAKLVETTAQTLKLKTTPPLLITEFNCGLGLDCADAPYAASFVAHQVLSANRTGSSIPFQSYWTFSDIFEEQGQQPSEFSQAFGAQSINGVPKPVYRGMQLIKRLYNKSIPVTVVGDAKNLSVDVIVTVGDDGEFECLVTNHPGGPTKLPAPIAPPTEVVLKFTSAVTKPTTVAVRRVDDSHSNALTLYKAAGSPQYPNKTLLSALQTASETTVEHLAPESGDGTTWSVRIQMPQFSVASISF